MALKYKLDTLDSLDDATKALYKKVGDKFVLDAEGIEDGDVVGLKAQNEALLAEKKKVEKKLKEQTEAQAAEAEKARKAAEEAARASGDVSALDQSWTKKHTDALAAKDAEYKPAIEKLTANMRRLLIDNVAQGIAGKIGLKGSEYVLIPHIVKRLDVEERDGEMVTVVRDDNGKASALTLEDLEKEFVGNDAFAPIIVGSQASGSGASGQNKGGGAAGANGKTKTMKRSDFDKLDPAGRATAAKEVTIVD